MEHIEAAKFKAKCHEILKHLGPDGAIVTKHGTPIARIIPAAADCAELIGSMKGKINICGDIFSATGRA